MNAQTSKKTNEPTIIFEYAGDRDVPTRVSTGGETFEVIDGRFEAPAKYAQGLGYLGFQTRGTPRTKPKANGEGTGAHIGKDRSKNGVSK